MQENYRELWEDCLESSKIKNRPKCGQTHRGTAAAQEQETVRD